MLNRYPLWKNGLIILIILIGGIYALPNLYGTYPTVEISAATPDHLIDSNTVTTLTTTLQKANIPSLSIQEENHNVYIRFDSTDQQLKAKEIIQQTLGDGYLVALNLSAATPAWLQAIRAYPMHLGLDLRGGVHLLLQVDSDSILKQRSESDLNTITQALRAQHIRYSDFVFKNNQLQLQFRDPDALDDAYRLLRERFPDFLWMKNQLSIQGSLEKNALQQIRKEIMEQAMNTLRHRVNELGVSEAIVQQQGLSRVSVDLPGIQDTTQAKNILGKTATLEFRLVDVEHDAHDALMHIPPEGTQLYQYSNQPILLKNEIILRGSSIISARSGMSEDGRPSVDVRLGGGHESVFTETTARNIGKPMAVVYVEVKSTTRDVNGKKDIQYQTERRIISVATIQSALGNTFQITGLSSPEESRTLALLLRAGALPAPVTVIEERQVGPSLGQQNIHMGVLSVEVGFLLIVIFMALYYRLFGIIADMALTLNLILIVALLSWLGATLTLPGIAGIVLTVGMAADANVLIFERIREELRNGAGVQASIYAGYEKAFVTIVDANVTTLIVAIVLFSLGSGAVKSFAVTLTIGLLTSMFTAITGTRAIVNALYGRRSSVKTLSIGL